MRVGLGSLDGGPGFTDVVQVAGDDAVRKDDDLTEPVLGQHRQGEGQNDTNRRLRQHAVEGTIDTGIWRGSAPGSRFGGEGWGERACPRGDVVVERGPKTEEMNKEE